IDTRNQNGITPFLAVHRKEGSKSANIAENAACERLMREILDSFFGSIRPIYVDARVRVGDGFGRVLRHQRSQVGKFCWARIRRTAQTVAIVARCSGWLRTQSRTIFWCSVSQLLGDVRREEIHQHAKQREPSDAVSGEYPDIPALVRSSRA